MADVCCPKCQYVRKASDRHVMEGVCPACGIAYNKWEISQRTKRAESHALLETTGWLTKAKAVLLYVPDQTGAIRFWGRVGIYVLFFIWGWWFITAGISWVKVGGSFMHNINLPFHEFGHLLFRPLGNFMTILGGSLFQILLPVIFLLVFIIKQKDNFAASIMLWWTGQNFIDLAPYIADAEYRAIPLIGGLGEHAHDWGNLLTMTGTLADAHRVATTSFSIGVLLILLSFLWGGYLLYLQKKNLNTWN